MGRTSRRAGWTGSGVFFFGVFFFALAMGPALSCAGEVPEQADPPEQLKRVAELRLDGDDAAADQMLRDVVSGYADFAPARWQAGFAQVDGAWVRPEQTAAIARPNGNLADYRVLRDAVVATEFPKQYGASTGPQARGDATITVGRRVSDEAAPSPAAAYAHFQLALWCRQRDLRDEARVHFYQAVQNDSSYLKQVAQRLGLVPYDGQLLTPQQVAEARAREVRQALDQKTWTARLMQWRKAARSKTAKVRDAALAEMAAIDDARAIPAAESFTLPTENSPNFSGAAPAFDLAVVELLGRLPDPVATQSLARHAVLAEDAKLRLAAAERLRDRPLTEVAPLLLAGFGWPVKFAQQGQMTPGAEWGAQRRTTTGQSERSRLDLLKPGGDYQVGKQNVHVPNTWQESITKEKWGQVEFMYNYRPPTSTYVATLIVEGPGQIVEQNVVSHVSGGTDGHVGTATYQAMSQQLQQSVARYNAELPERNERIAAALAVALATRIEQGVRSEAPSESSDPDAWYQWWYDYNELDRPERKRYVNVDYAVQAQGTSPSAYAYSSAYNWHDSHVDSHTFTASCFPKGTPIDTATGSAAVETIKIGDRVLAQDCQTGELAFKPVLGTTIRPPAALLAIRLGEATLRSTKGHPFFVVGKGWRMAKELQAGDKLVSLGRLVAIDEISPETEKVEAHNLVVADSSTYFVGEDHILVHDNSPIQPSRVLLPGYARDAQ